MASEWGWCSARPLCSAGARWTGTFNLCQPEPCCDYVQIRNTESEAWHEDGWRERTATPWEDWCLVLMLSCFVQYLTRAICLSCFKRTVQWWVDNSVCPSLIDCSDVLCKAGNVYIRCSVSKLFKDFPSWPTTRLQAVPNTHTLLTVCWAASENVKSTLLSFYVFYNFIPVVRGSRFVIKLTPVGPGLS